MEPPDRRAGIIDESQVATIEEPGRAGSEDMDALVTQTSDAALAVPESVGMTRDLGVRADGAKAPAERKSKRKSKVDIEQPQRIDRYVILSRVGAGGMGVVYQAYDPQLDRRVAIKLLLARKTRRKARLRLWREAQALAQLSDPNVVSVFDIGVWEGKVFVAMEFVEGQSMDDWLAAEERTRKQILEIFIAAGRGLAAAHAAGLVHRDFKPANVMVGDDGRVRVLDFGLARASERDDESATSGDGGGDPGSDAARNGNGHGGSAGPGEHGGLLDNPVTEHGAIIGTPAYMSPEQLEGYIDLSPSTDQYSFCIALYEALYGRRPFAGSSLAELTRNVLAGELAELPAEARGEVPTWLRRVLVRGLERYSKERYPSMGELLAELTFDRLAIWRKLATVAVVAVAVIAVIIASTAREDSIDHRARCADNQPYLAGVWDEPARQRIQQRFEALGESAATIAYHRVRVGLDEYAGAWAEQRTAACMATYVHRTQSSTLLDRRMGCLERRLARMDELIAVLDTSLGADNLADMVDATYQLPGLEACGDEDSLLRAYPAPESAERADAVAAQSRRIDRAVALKQAGKYERASAIARDVIERARAFDYPPLSARAHFEYGGLLAVDGRWDEAETTYQAAIRYGAQARDDTLLAQVWTSRAWLLGYNLGALQRGLDATEVAEMLVARAGNDPRLAAAVISYRGVLKAVSGDTAAAIEHFKREVALLEKVFDPEHPRLARGNGNLGKALMEQGRYREALPYAERSMAIRAANIGPAHPDVAKAYLTMGQLRQSRAEYDQALALYRRSIDATSAAFGDDHMELSYALTLAGSLWHERGDYGQARDYFERAIAMLEQQAGPEHHYLVNALDPLGATLRAIGAWERASALHERARKLMDKRAQTPAVEVARNLRALGDLARERGRPEQAVEHHRQAVQQLSDARLQGFERARAHESLALTQAALGRRDSARDSFDAALAALAFGVDDSHPYAAMLRARRARDGAVEQSARAVYAESLSQVRRALGERHPWVAELLLAQARTYVADKQFGEAQPLLERAIATWENDGRGTHSPVLVSQVYVLLARALAFGPRPDKRRVGQLMKRAARAGGLQPR